MVKNNNKKWSSNLIEKKVKNNEIEKKINFKNHLK